MVYSVGILAFITRYQPFYVLAYILANLTMLFFIFPSSYMPQWNDETLFGFLLIISALNAGMFLFCFTKKIKSKTILYLSFLMTYGLLFYIAADSSMPVHVFFNIIYGLLLLYTGFIFLKKSNDKSLFTITIIFAAIFLVYRVFYWVAVNYGEWMLYGLLIFAIFLTLTSVIIAGLLNRNKMNQFLTQTLIVCITIIATLFATFAISGIFFIVFPDATFDALYFFAILALITPGLLTKWPAQIRYTLLGTGFILGFAAAIAADQLFYQCILFLLLLAGVYIAKTKGIKILIFLFANIVLYSILYHWFNFHQMYILIFSLNLLYYAFQKQDRATNSTAFILALLNLMALTFLDLSLWLVIVYNALFLIITSLLLLFLNRDTRKLEWTASFVLWFIFIAYNYYEYLWSLIHKSIAALIAGIILIGIAAFYERRNNQKSKTDSTFIDYKTPLLLILIVLQVGFIGFQSYTSEKLLQEGELIKLQLQPVDPRSMLQGDYVILHYDINDLYFHEDGWNKKVKVLLQEKNGVYQYGGNYYIDHQWHHDYRRQPGDVIMNGTIHSYQNIVYGIESYFIPEGSGRDLETSAKYAYVRVGKTGNAIVEIVE